MRWARLHQMVASSLVAVLVAACGAPIEASPTTPATLPGHDVVQGPTAGTPPAAESAPHTTTPTPSGSALPAGEDTTVERVIDGDTIVVAGGTRVRLIGIDTPETEDPRKPVGCFGREASARTAELLADGSPVRLVYDVERVDRFGRDLAYVHRLADGLFVNAALVADGYAQVSTFPPNVAHVEEFTQLARRAREEGRGLWGACGDGAPAPVSASPPALPPRSSGGGCHPSYPGACIPPAPPDLDCGDVVDRRFEVLPPDPHGFDGDRDGFGCES